MIIVMISGGLGNQLFQYSFAKALQQSGQQVYIDVQTWWREAQLEGFQATKRELALEKFEITVPKIECKKTIWKYFFVCYNNNYISKVIMRWLRKRSLNGKGNYFYECGLNRISFEELKKTNANYYIKSYFQNPKYFENITDQIRRDLSLKKKIILDSKIEQLLQTRNVVALHIRRGDYVELGECLDQAYYLAALEYVKKHVENPLVFIFSDDLVWAKTLQIPLDIYIANEDRSLNDYEELILMSKCHHFIISNSTFSWWGAWLSDNQKKIVIAPQKWFHVGSTNEIVPSDWIKL